MKKPVFLLLFVFFYGRQHAQFRAVLTEGDYAPATLKLGVDEQNKKYKDVPKAFFDEKRKLWHATWTQFDAYKSKQKKDVSVIYYSRSDEGKTWTPPRQLNSFPGDCLDGDSTVKGPMPCVGPAGEIYVTWASPKGLAFQCSRDSGKIWLKEEKIINPIKGGWSAKVDEIKTNGLPFIACDLSKGEHRGRIYICWSDEKNGVKNKDVFLVYSDDQGEHWTEPILVTYRPNHKDQFRPCMKVDTLTGTVCLLYFDRQNYPEGKDTDIYLALSKNGGLKFDYYKVNETAFTYNANFLELSGDSSISARWVQVDGSKRFGLYEAVINDSTIAENAARNASAEIAIERSFTFADKMKIPYTIKKNAMLTAVITRPLEPGFEKVLVKNLRVFEGKNELALDLKAAGLKKGNYTLTLYYNGRNSFVWITGE